MVKISGSKTITSGETELFSVPDPYVAYLVRLVVSNNTASLATVGVLFYNGSFSKPVLTLKVPANSSISLREEELPVEGCPTKISVSTNVEVTVNFSIDLR